MVAATAVLFSACDVGSTEKTSITEVDEYGDIFSAEGIEGTFALRQVGGEETLVWNAGRAEQRFVPASTFKILNSMIILDRGVVETVDETIPWDQVDRDVDAWNGSQSLRSGIKVSAVWAFQEWARAVGHDSMAEAVAAVGYGNADIGDAVDRFWLDGPLQISALEQLDFLEDMSVDKLPFPTDVVSAVEEILVQESGTDWSWSYKTGTSLRSEPQLGWLVGSTVSNGDRWVFALNLDLELPADAASQLDPEQRKRIARTLLVDAGALPSEAIQP